MTLEQAEEALRLLREIHTAVVRPPAIPGDPVVKLLPRSWKGEDYRGKRFSETSPSFLGQLAHVLDNFANRDDASSDARRAAWNREAAEAARRWRARLSEQPRPVPLSAADLDKMF